jgi:hypothetical protein
MNKQEMLESIVGILETAIKTSSWAGNPDICDAHCRISQHICDGVSCEDCPFTQINHTKAKEYLDELLNIVKLEDLIK